MRRSAEIAEIRSAPSASLSILRMIKGMARQRILTALDLGSATIRALAGVATDHGLEIIGAAEHPSAGIAKGLVSSVEDATSSISAVMEKLERMTSLPVERATIAISGGNILSSLSRGVVAASRASGEMSEEDVERAIEAAEAVASPPNYEVLHVIPRTFSVDNQVAVKDPVGMTGVRLEVETLVIQTLGSNLRNITKCVHRAGVNVEDIVFGPLAAADAVLSKRAKELGVAIVVLGQDTSSLALFEEGNVLAAASLPVGAGHITNDIAIGLRISVDLAELVKLEYGVTLASSVGKHETIDLSSLSDESGERVSRREVAEIIEARLEEIFRLLAKEIERAGRAGLLPAGVVFTGGGSKLPLLVELAKTTFRLPSFQGAVQIATPIDRATDPAFSTCLGLLVGREGMTRASRSFIPFLPLLSLGGGPSRLKRLLKNLLP